ncbi:MAG: septum formation protein Maf [Chitinophagaceae bacterium]|nr:septum formation protein Maf [Chitinophagaceae bacterium]
MDKLILASQSPRRQQLMEQAGYQFTVIAADVDETNPIGMAGELVPAFLAHKKALAIAQNYPDDTIIAADTIVLLGNEILGKPVDSEDAMAMLQSLSGNMHRVVTGVCIWTKNEIQQFSVITEVYFRPLSLQQIQYYITHYKPFDKAGSYAIQEWIGMVGIEKINGDYYNVMGLPIGELVKRL